MNRILVWDWPVRVGHWLMVISFVLAWLTGESETFRLVHVVAGGTLVGVASFRIIWGLIGTRTARFTDFVRGPAAVIQYLKSLVNLQPAHFTGHNPAGGWAIVLLLLFGILTGVSGWVIYNDIGGHWLEELHEGLATAMLGVVLVHLIGVFSGSLMHGENLVKAMFNGHKLGEAHEAISSSRLVVVPLLLLWAGAVSWYVLR